jgi:Xaa-Pro aminopeptidase
VWPREGEPVLLAAAIERASLRGRSTIGDVRTYAGATEGAVTALGTLLRERGLAKARIGVDLAHVSAHFYRTLQRAVPDAAIVDATPLLARVRAIKSAREIEALRVAAQATDRAEWAALDDFRIGWTEADLGIRLRSRRKIRVENSRTEGAGGLSHPGSPTVNDGVPGSPPRLLK